MNKIELERTYKLFTPGPVEIPNRIAVAGSIACYHHRTKEFGRIICDALDGLKPLWGTEEQVVTVNTTGRGAIEGAFNNFLSPDKDKVLCVCNGRFGEMGKEILQAIGIPEVTCFEGWADVVDPMKLKELAIEHKVTAVFVVHSDTSNGILNPVCEIGKVCKELNLLLFVDAISSFACVPFKFDEWSVDVAVTGIQKGLMCPAGLSVMVMSERAMKANETIPQRDYYINIKSIRSFLMTKREAPFTTPVSLGLSMNEAVNMIQEEGVENVFKRHRVLSLATKEAVQAIGMELYPKTEGLDRSDSLTVCTLPEGIVREDLLKKLQDKYGYMFTSAMGNPNGLRIAHMGNCHFTDMVSCFAVLECALYELTGKDSFGKGVKTFLDTYNRLMEQA